MKTTKTILLCAAAACAATAAETNGTAAAEAPDVPPASAVAAPETVARAEAGDAEAQLLVGHAFELAGDDAREPSPHVAFERYAEAVRWYRKAAEQGHSGAQAQLAWALDRGAGVERDMAEAVEWYRKAAEQGNARAQFNLAVHYENGDGVEKDVTQAVAWYRKSAEQGDARAQFNLAVHYTIGDGVERDMAEAVEWYRKAAEQGDARAQYNLGVCYQYGEGVEKDTAQAVEWYRKAAKRGDPGALDALEEVTGQELRTGGAYYANTPATEALIRARNSGILWGLPGLTVLEQEILDSLEARAQDPDGAGEENGNGPVPPEAGTAVDFLGDPDSPVDPDFVRGLSRYFGIGCEADATAGRNLLGPSFSVLLDVFWNEGKAFIPYLCDDTTKLEVGYDFSELDEISKNLSPWQSAMAWFPRNPADPSRGRTYGVPLDGTRPSFEEAVKRFKLGAERDARSAFWLGMCHAQGFGTEKSMEEAVRCFERSCDLGGVGYRGKAGSTEEVPNRPQICLAICKLLGLGTERDFAAGVDNLYPRFMICKGLEKGWENGGKTAWEKWSGYERGWNVRPSADGNAAAKQGAEP